MITPALTMLRYTLVMVLAAAPATELSPALTLELLTAATQTLRREYVARLEVARLELERRVGTLVLNYHEKSFS